MTRDYFTPMTLTSFHPIRGLRLITTQKDFQSNFIYTRANLEVAAPCFQGETQAGIPINSMSTSVIMRLPEYAYNNLVYHINTGFGIVRKFPRFYHLKRVSSPAVPTVCVLGQQEHLVRVLM
ncbi:MAG: hypothetical protein U0X76_03705 [Bacteroidia bacterium]